MAVSFEFQNEEEGVRAQANQWLARFAPLIMDAPTPVTKSFETTQRQLKLTQELRSESSALLYKLGNLWEASDLELAETIRTATAQLPSVESDLRQHLAKVAPGDPNGQVNLDELQSRLAEREAKQEIGLPTVALIPDVLNLETSPRNIATAMGTGLFAIAWNGFVLMHSILMIGGFYKSFGWFALGLLAFYALFYGVGFLTILGVVDALSIETVEFKGRELTVTKTLWGWVRKKTFTLSPQSRAKVQYSLQASSKNGKKDQSIVFTKANGTEIAIASGITQERRHMLAQQINDYLTVKG